MKLLMFLISLWILVWTGVSEGSIPRKYRDTLMSLLEQSHFAEADSLFALYDAAGQLDNNDLIQWAYVSSVQENFQRATSLFCRIHRIDPSRLPFLMLQIGSMVRQADSVSRFDVLKSVAQCFLQTPGADTGAIAGWIWETCLGTGSFDEGLRLLELFPIGSARVGRIRLDAARFFFSRNDPAKSARCAVAAYPSLTQSQGQVLCAWIAYQSFAYLKKTDSALIWLARTPVADKMFIVSAAVFYQQIGMLPFADSLIARMPPGMSKDTLRLRQLIYSDSCFAAEKQCLRMQEHAWWKQDVLQCALWRLRCTLFDGNIDSAANLLREWRPPSDWEYAPELIAMKYRWRIVSNTPEAWPDFCHLELALWKRSPQELGRTIAVKKYPIAVKNMFISTLAGQLIDDFDFGNAAIVLEKGDTLEFTPENEFYRAMVQLKQGSISAAQKSLENLILNHPGQLFSAKARIYMLGIRAKTNP